MLRWGRIGFSIASLLTVAPASAADRVALVIGNSTYQHSGRLANPKNDATDISISLRKLGLKVIEGFDLDKAAFDRKVRDFAAALQGAEAGVFFFAGHGLQVGGQNYLVPVDAELKTASALDFEMVRVDVVQRVMETETNTNVLFLDACRDNPLARNLARAMGTRSSEIGRGFAPVVSGVGTLISFSTQPGNVALDGNGRNSPFATALVKQLATPKDDLSAILIDVRNDVMKETQNKQVPWEHSALRGRFYFNTGPPGPVSLIVPPPPVQPQMSEAERAWQFVKDTQSIAALEAFRRQYSSANALYDQLAANRIEELKKQHVAVATPPPAKSPETAAVPAISTLGRCDDGIAEWFSGSSPVRRCLKPKDTFRDCPDCPEMVVVPAGSFTMGSPASEQGRTDVEGPQHKVTIARPFAVGKYEVTFAEWEACVAGGGCAGNKSPFDYGWGKGRRPVIGVSWHDAKEYVTWLSRKSGRPYRLLSEAEWEYAARAGTSTVYSWGNEIGRNRANCDGCGSQQDKMKTGIVGSFPANAFGLHDMHGNVWEWVEDCSGIYANASVDGSAYITSCTERILRGGSWYSDHRYARAAARLGNASADLNQYSGFRLARTLGP